MTDKTLGHYKILSEIGRGGMGKVYAAEDAKLGRRVALKMLPPEVVGDPERQQRFEREARAVAALNHPNIVTVYSVEESEGAHFITMELVQGKSLSELIPTSGLPLSRFFDLAVPLADAVSAAHQQGITHRDLKPGNVMVSDEGRVKVLDFGLAKLRKEALEGSERSQLPTISTTEAGKIVGTVAYMSPEQAEGKPVDHRSDIFSLGVILYEMTTGGRPFKGDTKISVISSILRDTPAAITELNRALPRELDRILRRALAKDPGRRYQSAVDLRSDLEDLKKDLDSGVLQSSALAPAKRIARTWRIALPLGTGAAAVVALAVAYVAVRGGRLSGPNPAPPLVAALNQLTDQAGEERFPSLSPDGKSVAYASRPAGNWDIYVQRVGGGNAINLTRDSPADDLHPAFSPDGERIAFRSDRDGGGLFVMGATGESVRRLADFCYHPAWSPAGDEIACSTEPIWDPRFRATESQIWIIRVATGEKRRILTGDAAQPSCVSPWRPDCLLGPPEGGVAGHLHGARAGRSRGPGH